MGTRKRPEIESLSTQVGLLRGINVAGQKRVPMAELRALAKRIGFLDVHTYIQSGNLIYRTSKNARDAAALLSHGLEETFGFSVNVVVRTGAEWLGYAEASAFPDAEGERPKTLLLALADAPPPESAVELIRSYATDERAELRGDALWIDFASGSGRSKIRPAVLQRALGASATTRNWSTVQAIAKLVRELSP